MAWTSLCEFSELREGEGKYVQISGFELAVFLHGGNVYVLDNRCPHAGANLSGGWIEDDCVVCPRHCWPFRLDSGQLKHAPGVMVDTFPTRLLEREEGKSPLVQADLPIY
jgi:nitrite reductase (NADH) small subunit/3-phenylpropionate/trans-cinnamate dioxygenase ferredoxin subunit